MDMAGNVLEWTAADYETGSGKTVRGGSFHFDPRDLRAAIRGYFFPGNRNGYVGFRCAQDP
jgi:formylglycine-generating enzyme required for sulfatase activity